MSATSAPRHLSSYAPGVPAEVEVPDLRLHDLLVEAAERYPDRAALDWFGRTTTYAQLRRQVEQAAAALHDTGVRAGDRVAICLPTCPQHVVAFYAITRLGAIVVEHNPLYTPEELAGPVADHGARVAIVWDKVADAVAESTDLEQVFSVDITATLPLLKRLALRLPVQKARQTREAMHGPSRRGTDWDSWVAHQHPPAPEVSVSADDVALLLYTGGSTGTPKGVRLTHHNLIANVTQSRAWVPELKDGQETIYGILPLFHAYGVMLCLLCAVRLGATLVMFPKFDADLVIAAQKRRPATFLPGVPPIYSKLLDAAPADLDLTSVTCALSGAMSLPAGLVERWEARTGGLLIEGYGMTELSPIALGNPMASTRKPGAVGVPFPSTEVRIADPDDPTRAVADGRSGELQVRGPQVCDGYWNHPELTAETILPDGFLRTGDIAVMDDDGFVTIVDRIKDLVIVGGFNVYPSEIEDVLRTFPEVDEASVVGLRDDDGVEQLVAVVVSRQTVDTDDLRGRLREHLTGYKVPRRIVQVDELPVSQVGKTVAKDVRAMLERLDAD